MKTKKPPIIWVDNVGTKHTMTHAKATKVLKKLYDEWPGGLNEIDSYVISINAAFKEAGNLVEKAINKLKEAYEI